MSMKTILCLCLPLLIVGCATEVEGDRSPREATTPQLVGGAEPEDCSSNNCGLNSPVIDGVYFSQLSRNPNQPNDQSFYLKGIANSVDAAEDNQQHPTPAGLVTGTQLNMNVGEVMVVAREGKKYYVRLADKWETSNPNVQYYWAEPSTQAVPWYKLQYTTPEAVQACPHGTASPACPTWVDVCPHQRLDDKWRALGAMVYEGNRYTQATLKVDTTLDKPTERGWFVVACNKSLPAKMLLMRRVQIDAYAPSLAEQQAYANMWAGNYCGDGKVFTKAGWPLGVRTKLAPSVNGSLALSHGASLEDTEVQSIDAVWNTSGAACLSTPRLDRLNPPSKVMPPTYSSWYDEIQAHCRSVGRAELPPCPASLDRSAWSSLGSVISLNPL